MVFLTVYVYLINLERLLIKPGLDRIQINQIFYYILLLICIFLFVSISFCSCFGLSWISVFKYFKILFSTLKCSFAGILSTLFQRIQCLSIRWYIFSDNDTSTTWKPLYCPRCYKIPFGSIHPRFRNTLVCQLNPPIKRRIRFYISRLLCSRSKTRIVIFFESYFKVNCFNDCSMSLANSNASFPFLSLPYNGTSWNQYFTCSWCVKLFTSPEDVKVNWSWCRFLVPGSFVWNY
jgi:hypothetical protein